MAKENVGQHYTYWIGGYSFGSSDLGLYTWTDNSKFDFELFEGNPNGEGCLYQDDYYEGKNCGDIIFLMNMTPF